MQPAALLDPRAPRVWTYDDLAALPEDGTRYEILDGRLVMSPSPITRHQVASLNLTELLSTQLRRTGLARLFVAPYDVKLSPTRVVEPDLVVVAVERAAIVTPACVVGVPDLLVEILSPSTAHVDRGEKQRIYGDAGVAEYWVVDPDAETVEVLRNDGAGALLAVATHAGAEVVRSARFPSIAFAAAAVFVP